MRIVHYSVQGDHIHPLVEAIDRRSLSRGVQGLAVRIARAVNGLMHRLGKVFADRYHERVLGTPTQVRNGLGYVLCNGRKHGHAPRLGWIDPCSSARALDGWRDAPPIAPTDPRPLVAPPRTWLLREGWRRGGGSIPIDHAPGATP